MSCLTEVYNHINKLSTAVVAHYKGCVRMQRNHYYSVKKLTSILKHLAKPEQLRIEVYGEFVYIHDLLSKESVEAWYGLQLQKELDINKKVLTLKEVNLAVLKLVVKLKEQHGIQK